MMAWWTNVYERFIVHHFIYQNDIDFKRRIKNTEMSVESSVIKSVSDSHFMVMAWARAVERSLMSHKVHNTQWCN